MATRKREAEEEARAAALGTIGAAIDGAQDAPVFAQEGDLRPFGGPDEHDEYDAPEFPPDCPVTPLGKLGQTCFYLDVTGEIIALEMGNKHGKNNLAGLFGTKDGWLWRHFPQWSKPVREREAGTNKWEIVKESEIVGYDQAAASRAMIIECTRRGIFDPAGRVRGAGAHRGEADALILHCGDQVLLAPLHINGAPAERLWLHPGLHGDHVYPAAAAIPRPWPDRAGEQSAGRMLALLQRWNWARPQLDPLLILGAIGAAMIGGALDWRSNLWITGGKGTGKSTLNGKRGLLDLTFGKGAVRSADATGAYLRQRLKTSTLPVFLDEIEAKDDNRRNETILELARVSSSGDDAGRGGQDHQAAEFTLQSAFFASSILLPPMEPQDRSRWAVCRLNPIPEGAKRPDLRAERLPELGRQLLRRMIEGWHRWDATLAMYVEALSDIGHSARACMQFGTLLAAADLLQNDTMPDDETVELIASLCGKDMLREVAETAEEHELCINHLRTSMVQSRGGDPRESIGTWIGAAMQEICDNLVDTVGKPIQKQHRQLQELGLKIVQRTEKGSTIWAPGARGYLAVANTHQALQGIFGATKWKSGVWAGALGYAPGAAMATAKFNRVSARATLVPLELVIDASEVPKSARWEGLEGDKNGGEE